MGTTLKVPIVVFFCSRKKEKLMRSYFLYFWLSVFLSMYFLKDRIKFSRRPNLALRLPTPDLFRTCIFVYTFSLNTCVPCAILFLSVSSINKIPPAWSFQNSTFVLWRAKVTMSIAPSRRSRDLSTNFWRLSHLANLKRSVNVPGGNQAPSPATGIFKQNR